MTVKDLRSMLEADDDELTVLVRPKTPGIDLGAPFFRVACVEHSLDPDTAEDVIILECDQEG